MASENLPASDTTSEYVSLLEGASFVRLAEAAKAMGKFKMAADYVKKAARLGVTESNVDTVEEQLMDEDDDSNGKKKFDFSVLSQLGQALRGAGNNVNGINGVN